MVDDVFFKTFILKLFVSFLRDCGGEAYDLFQNKIVPKLGQVVNVNDVKLVEVVFGTLAAGLKFLLKSCL